MEVAKNAAYIKLIYEQDVDHIREDLDLILADEIYIDDILNAIDNYTLSIDKLTLLISTLCVIVYNNSKITGSEINIDLRNSIINELNKRIDKIKLVEYKLYDYIKENVFTQLNTFEI